MAGDSVVRDARGQIRSLPRHGRRRRELVPLDLSSKAAVEATVIGQLTPAQRAVAQYVAEGIKKTDVAKRLGYAKQSLSRMLRDPILKEAIRFYQQGLHEKAVAAQHMAVNVLPRGIEKTAELLEKADIDPRHIINATGMLAKVAGQWEQAAGDRVQQKIVINLSPDAARQLGGVGVLAGVPAPMASDVEWEEVVDEEEDE